MDLETEVERCHRAGPGSQRARSKKWETNSTSSGSEYWFTAAKQCWTSNIQALSIFVTSRQHCACCHPILVSKIQFLISP